MPRASTAQPFWDRDPQLWDMFLAAYPTSGTGAPVDAIEHRGERIRLRALIRDIQQLEDRLSEAQLDQLDAIDFQWDAPAPPSRPAQEDPAPAPPAGRRQLQLLRSGQLTLEEVLALRTHPTTGVDPLAVWFTRGIGALRNSWAPVIAVLADPDRVGRYHEEAFTLGHWAPEAARAVARGHYDGVLEQIAEPFTTSERFTLRNIGLLADILAADPNAVLAESLIVPLADGTQYRLGKWLNELSRRARRGTIDPDTPAAFRRIGLDLTVTPTDRMWDRNLAAAARYLKDRGEPTVPAGITALLGDGTEFNLSRWVDSAWAAWSKGQLSADQADRFVALGLHAPRPAPDHATRRLQATLTALQSFVAEHDLRDLTNDLPIDMANGTTTTLRNARKELQRRANNHDLDPETLTAFRRCGIDLEISEHDPRWIGTLQVIADYLEDTDRETVPLGLSGALPDGTTIDLYGWVSRNRSAFREHRMPHHRARAFAALGLHHVDLTPGVRRSSFEANLQAFEEYAATHDDPEPPRNFIATRADGTTLDLSLWLRHVRQRYAIGKIPAPYVERFERLGVRLEVYNHTDRAVDALIALKQFVHREGNADVPYSHRERLPSGTDFDLGTWLRSQRRRHERGDLADDRKAELEALGVDLRPQRSFEEEWRLGLTALDRYIERTGTAGPRLHDEEQLSDGTTVPVGQWLATKRKQYRDGNLSAERIAALEARGVIWSPQRTHFKTGLRLLAKFKQEHGHVEVPTRCAVPGPDGEPFKLGAWLDTQRKQLARGATAPDRKAALARLGVTATNRYEEKFTRGLALLDAFVAEHGHGAVPEKHVATTSDGMEVKLGHWVLNFRNQDKLGTLDPERRAILEAHGLVFDVPEFRFQRGLVVLDRYIAREGTAAMKNSHVEVLDDGTEFPLGQWVEIRRRSFQRGSLPPDHEAELRARGARLDPLEQHTEPSARGRG